MRTLLFASLLSLIPLPALATTAAEKAETIEAPVPTTLENAGEAVQETVETVRAQADRTRTRRAAAHYFALIDYSLLDLLVPGKYGATVGLIRDADQTWEFEYLRGGLSVPFVVQDLGSMTDQRFSLIGRSYWGRNSFNISYGVSYFDFSIHLGNDLISRVSAGYAPSTDLIEIQAFGIHGGFGNRWTFGKNITLGIDWLAWSQPVLLIRKDSPFLDYASNQGDKSAVSRAVNLVSYFPRFSMFKLQLGLLF